MTCSTCPNRIAPSEIPKGFTRCHRCRKVQPGKPGSPLTETRCVSCPGQLTVVDVRLRVRRCKACRTTAPGRPAVRRYADTPKAARMIDRNTVILEPELQPATTSWWLNTSREEFAAARQGHTFAPTKHGAAAPTPAVLEGWD